MLRQAILDRALKIGQGVDNDGRKMSLTLDFRELLLDPDTAPLIIEEFRRRIEGCTGKHVGGATMASSLIASQLMTVTDRHSFYIRKQAKQHGRQRRIEGVFGRKVILVDDILNKDGTLDMAKRIAEAEGAKVEKAVAILDLCKGGATQLGCPVETLFTIDDLVSRGDIPLFTHRTSVEMDGRTYKAGKCLECWSDGRLIWKLEYGDDLTLPCVKGKVYCHTISGTRGAILCIGQDGKLLWKQKTSTNRFAPATHLGRIITYKDGLRFADKDGLSEAIYDKKPAMLISEGERLYVLSDDGHLAMLIGKTIWERRLGRTGRHMQIRDRRIAVWTESFIELDKYCARTLGVTIQRKI